METVVRRSQRVYGAGHGLQITHAVVAWNRFTRPAGHRLTSAEARPVLAGRDDKRQDAQDLLGCLVPVRRRNLNLNLPQHHTTQHSTAPPPQAISSAPHLGVFVVLVEVVARSGDGGLLHHERLRGLVVDRRQRRDLSKPTDTST